VADAVCDVFELAEILNSPNTQVNSGQAMPLTSAEKPNKREKLPVFFNNVN